jgi:hypothetical protein
MSQSRFPTKATATATVAYFRRIRILHQTGIGATWLSPVAVAILYGPEPRMGSISGGSNDSKSLGAFKLNLETMLSSMLLRVPGNPIQISNSGLAFRDGA